MPPPTKKQNLHKEWGKQQKQQPTNWQRKQHQTNNDTERSRDWTRTNKKGQRFWNTQTPNTGRIYLWHPNMTLLALTNNWFYYPLKDGPRMTRVSIEKPFPREKLNLIHLKLNLNWLAAKILLLRAFQRVHTLECQTNIL